MGRSTRCGFSTRSLFERAYPGRGRTTHVRAAVGCPPRNTSDGVTRAPGRRHERPESPWVINGWRRPEGPHVKRHRARRPSAWFRVVRLVLRHARAAWPDECCGLLAVDPRGRIWTVPGENEAAHPRVQFSLAPAAFFRAAARGLEPVGVYHSHVDAPRLRSNLDRPPWPGARMRIVVLRGGRIERGSQPQATARCTRS